MSRLTALPFGYYASRRRDNRAVSQIVALMGLDPNTALGLELRSTLSARVSDCRDLFAQRGVCPKRASILRLAARSIRDDESAAWTSAVLSPIRAQALLAAAAALLDRVGRLGYQACVRDVAMAQLSATAPAAQAPAAEAPAAQALAAPLATTEAQVTALRAVHSAAAAEPSAPVLDPRFIPANAEASPVSDWDAPAVRLAA